MFEALAKLEEALVMKLQESGRITPEQEAGFTKYQKVKNLAIHPNTPANEAATALRLAAVEAIKLVF